MFVRVAAKASPAPSMWQEVHPDLFLRVLEHLDVTSRVRDVALVCKHWCRLCLEEPPPLGVLSIKVHPTFGASFSGFFHHFSKLSTSVEQVEVSLSAGLPGGLAAQTLGAAAIVFPKMRELSICFPKREVSFEDSDAARAALKGDGSDWDNLAPCFPAFRQLECLRLLDVQFVPRMWADRDAYYEGAVEDLRQADTSSQMFFCGMHLKELYIHNATEFSYEDDTNYYTKALSKAIQALTSLTKLHLDFSHPSELNWENAWELLEPDLDGVADSITAMPSLRCVTLMSKHAMELGPGWSNLTALTALTIKARMCSCDSLASLPALQSLDLHFLPYPDCQMEDYWGRVGDFEPDLLLPGSFTGLTHLAIRSQADICQEGLETMLPAAALQQLQCLLSFKLESHGDLSLTTQHQDGFMDLELLRCMPQLTRLDLSHNALPCLPPALSALTSLQELDVHDNEEFWVSRRCAGILKSLSSLKLLVIDDDFWSLVKGMWPTEDLLPSVRVQLMGTQHTDEEGLVRSQVSV